MDPIELQYDNMEAVPEAFRGLYTERDGKAVLTGVKGMKTEADISRLTTALNKERDEHKATKTKYQPYTSLGDVAEVQAKLDRIGELEAVAGGKLDAAGIETLVEKRLEGKIAQIKGPLDRKIEELSGNLTTVAGERDSLKGSLKRRDMNELVRSEALKSKVHASALQDVELVAHSMMEFDESGKLMTKDGSGITAGLNVAEWMTEMQKTRPHWWPESAGGGAGGGRGGVVDMSNNPWSAEHWNLTAQGKVLTERGRETADRMAKAAGTLVGGTKPKPKK